MYMYKTSILWSVWEGEHLGVSTFLTNYIKCTQGWIFYLFGFFFRTASYSALDFWTWKITRFTKIRVTNALSILLERLLPPHQPLPPDAAGGSWSQKAEISPQNCQTCLDLTTGTVGVFPAASRRRPTVRPPWSTPSQKYFCLHFQGDSSYLMGSIFFAWKSVWKIPGLEWCRKLWQNIWTAFSSLDISVLPEIQEFW